MSHQVIMRSGKHIPSPQIRSDDHIYLFHMVILEIKYRWQLFHAEHGMAKCSSGTVTQKYLIDFAESVTAPCDDRKPLTFKYDI